MGFFDFLSKTAFERQCANTRKAYPRSLGQLDPITALVAVVMYNSGAFLDVLRSSKPLKRRLGKSVADALLLEIAGYIFGQVHASAMTKGASSVEFNTVTRAIDGYLRLYSDATGTDFKGNQSLLNRRLGAYAPSEENAPPARLALELEQFLTLRGRAFKVPERQAMMQLATLFHNQTVQNILQRFAQPEETDYFLDAPLKMR
jgi:hypothetical protein